MSTRTVYSAALAIVWFAIACGEAKSPFDGEKKQFGQLPPRASDQPRDNVKLPPDGGIPPQSDDAKPRKKPPLPPPPPPTPDIDVEPEAPDPDVPTPAPDDLIEHGRYGVVFADETLIGMRDGSYRNLGNAVARRVREQLITTPADGLTVAQTFGDGESASRGIQTLQLAAADADLPPDATSTSGIQYLDRRVTPACPAPFICAERLTMVPNSGTSTALCFRDMTGAPALFPYGAVPSYGQADFAPVLGTYGPYRVEAYDDLTTDCAAPATTPSLTELVQVTVAAPTVDPTMRLHVIEPLPVDTVVSFRTERIEDDLVSPYLDETIGINLSSTYLMSKNDVKIVKLIVTSRQSVDIAADSGGGLFGGIVDWLVGIDGISVDLHFELCRDLLDEGSVDHCGEVVP
jgi:hypothetical protein